MQLDTVGEPQTQATRAKAANIEVRVLARGVPSNQLSVRARLIAAALPKCCKWVFCMPR